MHNYNDLCRNFQIKQGSITEHFLIKFLDHICRKLYQFHLNTKLEIFTYKKMLNSNVSLQKYVFKIAKLMLTQQEVPALYLLKTATYFLKL